MLPLNILPLRLTPAQAGPPTVKQDISVIENYAEASYKIEIEIESSLHCPILIPIVKGGDWRRGHFKRS